MCRYLPSSAVNRPVGLGVYTKAMMNNRILTICAAIAAGMGGHRLAVEKYAARISCRHRTGADRRQPESAAGRKATEAATVAIRS